MWSLGHAVGLSSHCGVKRSHSTHCCLPETRQPRWTLYAWAYRSFHFQKVRRKKISAAVCMCVWEVRKGLQDGVHPNSPSLKKGGKQEKKKKIRLVGGGHMFSALSPIWPKCLTSNFANSPQEHTKLLTQHCFQMFSVRRQHTDTCERFPPSRTEENWKFVQRKWVCVRVCACLDALVHVCVGLFSLPSILYLSSVCLCLCVCVLVFLGDWGLKMTHCITHWSRDTQIQWMWRDVLSQADQLWTQYKVCREERRKNSLVNTSNIWQS